MYTRHRFAPEGVSAQGYTLDETAILNERYATLIMQFNALRMYRQIDYNHGLFKDNMINLNRTFPELAQIVLLQSDNLQYDGVQCLLPCTTQKCKYLLKRARDLITAVYIPIDIDRVKLRVRSCGDSNDERVYNDAYSIIGNEFVLDAQLISDTKNINELLEECKLTPSQSGCNIESLLEDSRNIPSSEGYIHDGSADFITIGGEEYRRVVLIEPCIPMCAMQYATVDIHFDRNVTFYAEVVTLTDATRCKFMKTNSVLYTRYSSDPVIVLECGRLFNYGVRSVNDEQTYVQEEPPISENVNNNVYSCASSLLYPEPKFFEKDMSKVTVIHAPTRPTLCAMISGDAKVDGCEEVEVGVGVKKMNTSNN